MYGNSMRENREIPCLPSEDSPEGRVGKIKDRNPTMHGHGKSDRPIIPANLPNKTGLPVAEAGEGRCLTKGNTIQQNTSRTQCRNYDVSNALDRVRRTA
jgi:hypothetical protein